MSLRFNEGITSLITKNQMLLTKKGLLKTLLDDKIIRHLIEKTFNGEVDDLNLDADEKELIDLLIQNNFNLDSAIELMIRNVADEMSSPTEDN